MYGGPKVQFLLLSPPIYSVCTRNFCDTLFRDSLHSVSYKSGVFRPMQDLPTGSKEKKVLEVGSIPVAILPSCQYMKTIALYLHKHQYSWVVKIGKASEAVLGSQYTIHNIVALILLCVSYNY